MLPPLGSKILEDIDEAIDEALKCLEKLINFCHVIATKILTNDSETKI